MPKRALSSVLWFASAWVAYEILWSLTGVPRLIGPIIAAAVATFVALDPFTLFWPVERPARTTAPAIGSSQLQS